MFRKKIHGNGRNLTIKYFPRKQLDRKYFPAETILRGKVLNVTLTYKTSIELLLNRIHLTTSFMKEEHDIVQCQILEKYWKNI